MTRYFGKVGFVMTVETDPGVWEPVEQSREYFGDVISNARRWSAKTDSTNDNLAISNQVSIVADAFALDNMGAIKWAEFGGARWKVSHVNVEFPRLVLTLSELYSLSREVAENEEAGNA